MKVNFKSILKELAIWVLIIFVASNIMSYLRKPNLDSEYLPKIKAELLDGSEFSIVENEPLIIHFWATWCPTCKMEIDNIESISKKYEVLTIAVNSSDLKTYMKEKRLSFKVLDDIESKWTKKFKVKAFPTTFIYDSKGKLQFSEVGYTTTAGLLARLKLID